MSDRDGQFSSKNIGKEVNVLALRITPSLLESFRLYHEADFLSLQKLESRIKGEPITPTPAMLLGAAFHKIAETGGTLTVGYYLADGLLFDIAMTDDALALRGPGMPEVVCSRPMLAVPHQPLLKGRVDWISGAIPWELKTKDQPFQPEDYTWSLQWQSYLYMLNAEECRYLLVQLKEAGDCWEVANADVLSLFRYVGMEDHINEWATRFIRFCEDRGLLHYLTLKEG